MKNRIASLFLVFALLMSLCNFAVARDNRITVQSGGAERFTDVPTSHWAYAYIDKVVGSGLFNGKTPTTFEPSSAMTRSQFVMVMARMEGRSDLEGVETQTIFPDVTTTRRAAGPIKWATDEGFVNGFGDGTFKPDSPITRGQFAALIHRYIVAKRYVNLHPVEPEPAQFTDAASVSSAFTNDVEYARILGLLTGYSDGTVRAGNPITRAAIAAILARFLDLVTESGYTPLLDGPVIDGGDSGDSGDTGGSTDVPTEYDEVKLTVTGSTHGTTKLTITRDGKEVAADDVQAGDLVTITHEPDSGYGVSIRVRDAKNKSVKKTTANYKTTFKVPSTNLPVTVTVTYSKSSGGGGGSSGGSSTGGGTIVNPPAPTTPYYLLAQATVAPTAADNATHGTVFFVENPPTADMNLPQDPPLATQRDTHISQLLTNPNNRVTGYAVFVADANYELDKDSVVTTPDTVTVNKDFEPITHTSGVKLYYVAFSAIGNTQPGADTSDPANPRYLRAFDMTITASFKLIDNGSSDTPADKYTWTITPTVTGGYVGVYEDKATPQALTEPLKANVGLTVNSASAQFPDLEKGASKTVCVAVSPDTNHEPVAPNLTKTNDKVTISEPETLLDGWLYLYDVTLTGIDADVTTALTGSFPAGNIEPKIDVTAKYLHVDGTELTAEELKALTPLAPESDKPTAKKDDTVTVTAPVPDGYSIESVTVNGDATLAQKTGDSTPTAGKYTFTMPDGDAAVVVTYKENPPDEELYFKVNVKFEGEGSIALNVAGKEYMFKSDASDSENTKTLPMILRSEYNEKYGDGIPAYLVSATQAKGYKFDSIDPAGLDTTATNPYTGLTDKSENLTLTVTVKFVREYSYGYNLTMIGEGEATVTLGSVEKTYNGNGSYAMPPTNATSLTLNVKARAGAGYEAVDNTFKVLINDNSVSYDINDGASATVNPGTAEIVVAFLPEGATVVPFTVELVGDGKVDIRAENGSFLSLLQRPAKPDKDDVKGSDTRTAEVPNTDTGKRFSAWALSGTIITLTPDLGENVVIKSIEVDSQKQVRDELPSNGFSYSLVDIEGRENNMVVTTETFGGYSLLVQAPYEGELASGDVSLHSFSKVESESGDSDPAKTVTLQDILYSLNNGQRTTYIDENSFTTAANNIKNNVAATFGVLPKIAQLYLYDGGKTKSAEQLEERINKAVEASIKDNIGSIINSKKEEMLAGAEATIGKPLEEKLEKLTVPIPNDLETTMKPEIVQQVLNNDATPDAIKRAYAAKQITDDNFTVNLTATLLKLESDETSANVSDQARAKGKSLQAQIKRKLLGEYLRNSTNIDIFVGNEQANASNMGLTPKVELGTPVYVDDQNDPDKRELTVPISASASVSNKPRLNQDPTFKDFMTKGNGLDLDVWVVAKVTVSVTMPGATASTPLPEGEIFKQVTLDDTQVQTIKTQLDVIETTLNSKWDEEWVKLTSDANGNRLLDENGNAMLNIALGDIITEDMIVRIIKGSEDGTEEGLLTPILNRLSVESLGDAAATRSKVLSIYDDFMNFEAQDNSDKLKALQLKTKSGSYNDLLTVDGDKLVLTLNTNKLFKDVNASLGTLDQTSFELLVDLMVGLRDGVTTDIRNQTNQNPQSVISDMILKQLSSSKRVVTVTKWGKTVSSPNMNPTEKKELADLLAELIMQDTTVKLHDAWAKFEAKGYSSVEVKTIGMPNNADIRNALIKSPARFTSTTSLVGVKLERTSKTSATN